MLLFMCRFKFRRKMLQIVWAAKGSVDGRKCGVSILVSGDGSEGALLLYKSQTEHLLNVALAKHRIRPCDKVRSPGAGEVRSTLP